MSKRKQLSSNSVSSKVGKANNSSDRHEATGRFYKCLHEQLISNNTAVNMCPNLFIVQAFGAPPLHPLNIKANL